MLRYKRKLIFIPYTNERKDIIVMPYSGNLAKRNTYIQSIRDKNTEIAKLNIRIDTKVQKMNDAIKNDEEIVSWNENRRQLEIDIKQMRIDAERDGFLREFEEAERETPSPNRLVKWVKEDPTRSL